MTDTPENGPDAAHGQQRGRRGPLVRALTWLGSAAGIIVVVALLALILLRPRGETYLVITAPVAPEDSQELRSIFKTAEAFVAPIFAEHVSLSQRLSDQAVEPLAQPDFDDRTESRLDGALETFVAEGVLRADAEAERDDSPGIRFVLNLKAVVEGLYDDLQLRDYPVTLTDVQQVPCSDDSATCWKITVRYDAGSRPLTDILKGNREQIERDLGVFIVRAVAFSVGEEWLERSARDATLKPPFLLAQNIPRRHQRLDATSEGLRLIQDDCAGMADPVAQLECIEQARALLESALPNPEGGDPLNVENPAAAFGLAILKLHAANEAARNGGMEIEIERKLAEMGELLADARRSKFINAALERAASTGALPGFGPLFGGALDPSLLVDPAARGNGAANLNCALAQYRRALWDKCLAQLPKPETMPEAVGAYFEAAAFDAELHLAKASGEDTGATLTALDDRIAAYAPNLSLPLRMVRLRHSCNGPATADDLVRQQDVMLPHFESRPPRWFVQSELEVEFCRDGGLDAGRLEDIVTGPDAQPLDPLERQLLMIEVARLRARLGDVEGSYQAALDAIALPWAFGLIQQHPDFAPLAEDRDKLRALFLRRRTAVADSPGVREICREFTSGS